MPALILDENVSGNILSALRRSPNTGGGVIDVIQVGESSAPPKGTLDPDLLVWCEANDRVLVTNDRQTMPDHFQEHLAAGRHSPGALLIKRGLGIRAVVAELVFISEVGQSEDFRDQIQYIPLTPPA